jgi:hypothetical protein
MVHLLQLRGKNFYERTMHFFNGQKMHRKNLSISTFLKKKLNKISQTHVYSYFSRKTFRLTRKYWYQRYFAKISLLLVHYM